MLQFMKHSLKHFYLKTVSPSIIDGKEYEKYINRVTQDKLTRDENSLSHTCAMIIAFDPQTKKVLLVHHKKAQSWLFPGGHVDLGELPPQAALREAEEELSIKKTRADLLGPFGAQVLVIENPAQICREHYDLFYAIPVDTSEIMVNMQEFHAYEWVSVDKARKKIKLLYYRKALDKFIQFMAW